MQPISGTAAELLDTLSSDGRGADRESAIRDAALALLAEVGYDRMTMDAVAARAHASKATIYRRWPGKRELVLDAIRLSPVHQRIQLPDTGSLRGDLLAILRLMAGGIGSHDADLMAGMMRAMRSAPDLAECVRIQVIDQKRYVGNTLIARAVQRGELPADADPEVFHETAPALMFFRVLTASPLDDAFIVHVADDILIPLLAQKRSAKPTEETP